MPYRSPSRPSKPYQPTSTWPTRHNHYFVTTNGFVIPNLFLYRRLDQSCDRSGSRCRCPNEAIGHLSSRIPGQRKRTRTEQAHRVRSESQGYSKKGALGTGWIYLVCLFCYRKSASDGPLRVYVGQRTHTVCWSNVPVVCACARMSIFETSETGNSRIDIYSSFFISF